MIDIDEIRDVLASASLERPPEVVSFCSDLAMYADGLPVSLHVANRGIGDYATRIRQGCLQAAVLVQARICDREEAKLSGTTEFVGRAGVVGIANMIATKFDLPDAVCLFAAAMVALTIYEIGLNAFCKADLANEGAAPNDSDE